MADEPKLVNEFSHCEICHSEKLLTRDAWKEVRGEGDLAQVGSRKLAIPLTAQGPQAILATPIVPCMVLIWDICGGCGIERVVNSSVQNLPIGLAQQGAKPPGM